MNNDKMTSPTPKPRAGERGPYGNDYGDHRRIVACMCACEGIHTDALMPGQLKLQFDRLGHLAGVISERDLLRERERELVSMLIYWMPASEPLQDQHDEPSVNHKKTWHKTRALIAKYGR